MTEVDLSQFQIGASVEDTYEAVNDMTVTYRDFSQLSSLYARAYGMVTDSEQGTRGPEDEKLRAFVVNNCLRNAIYTALYAVQAETERLVGFNLSPRYHVEERVWPRDGKIQLNWPGVEQIECELNWYDIPEYELQELSPFILEDVAIIVDPDDATKQAVVLDATLVDNPEDVIIRRATGGIHGQQLALDTTYIPTYDPSGPTWTLRINHLNPVTSVGQLVNIQHRNYVILDVPAPDVDALPVGGTVYPVYPGTNQVIPQVRPVEDLGGGILRYTFWVYTLIAPPFKYRTVWWNRGEFHKIYPQIAFKYAVEEKAYIELIWTEGDEQFVYQYDPAETNSQANLELEIAMHKASILHLYMNCKLGAELGDIVPLWQRVCGDKRRKMPETATLRIKYRTNPNRLADVYRNQIPRLRYVMAAKAAAELPTEDCGCQTEIGYIGVNQRYYGSILQNEVTGVRIEYLKYGNRHGQVQYATELSKAVLYRPSLVLGKII